MKTYSSWSGPLPEAASTYVRVEIRAGSDRWRPWSSWCASCSAAPSSGSHQPRAVRAGTLHASSKGHRLDWLVWAVDLWIQQSTDTRAHGVNAHTCEILQHTHINAGCSSLGHCTLTPMQPIQQSYEVVKEYVVRAGPCLRIKSGLTTHTHHLQVRLS